jgi:hypothetical protein
VAREQAAADGAAKLSGGGITAIAYDASRQRQWDAFVDASKNGVFLFRRGYMDYHADRFPDASLLLFDGDALAAVLPATARDGATVSSHAGLTFGGLVTSTRMRTTVALETFAALRAHYAARGFQRLLYKAVPHIYHRVPADEDLYALFRLGARLVKREPTSAILLQEPVPFSKGRRWSAKQARRRGVEIRWTDDYDTFMAIEAHVLGSKYGLIPVHSAGELAMLARRFPQNISLMAAFLDGEMIAGVVTYESAVVAHAQYMAASDTGKQCGALDLILEHLITRHFAAKRVFDFGISCEQDGRVLNEGLIGNKEGFGARTVMHDLYELDLLAC